MKHGTGPTALSTLLVILAGCATQSGQQLASTASNGTIRLTIYWPATGAAAQAERLDLAAGRHRDNDGAGPRRDDASRDLSTSDREPNAVCLSHRASRGPVDDEPDGAHRVA